MTKRRNTSGIEPAIGVRDIGPRDAEDARETFEVAGCEFREFAVKAGRKVVANFAELFFYNIKIIDQPFGGGDDGLLVLNRARDGAVIFQQDAAVFHDARNERAAFFASADDGLRGRQAFRVLLQPLDAEKLGANRLFWFGKNRRRNLRRTSHVLAVLVLLERNARWPASIMRNSEWLHRVRNERADSNAPFQWR